MVDIYPCVANLDELEKKDKEIQRMKMLVKKGCNCEAELRGLRLGCWDTHSFMAGVGFDKYEWRIFLETRTSMIKLKAYIELIWRKDQRTLQKKEGSKEEISSMAFLVSNSTRAPPLVKSCSILKSKTSQHVNMVKSNEESNKAKNMKQLCHERPYSSGKSGIKYVWAYTKPSIIKSSTCVLKDYVANLKWP